MSATESRRLIHLTIDGKTYSTHDDDQEAASLLRLAGRDPEKHDLARVTHGSPLKVSKDSTVLNLHEGDEFISVKQELLAYNIIVNTRDVTVEDDQVTFEEITAIAYPVPPSPDTRFTVTFRKAKDPTEGTLKPGKSVLVKKEGTIFNVKATGKS